MAKKETTSVVTAIPVKTRTKNKTVKNKIQKA